MPVVRFEALRNFYASVIGLLNYAGTLVLKTWKTRIRGNHRQIPTGKMTPLRWEQLRFTCTAMKNGYDDVFVAYGRSVKPDLILAAWLHGHYTPSPNDERIMLPPELGQKEKTISGTREQ